MAKSISRDKLWKGLLEEFFYPFLVLFHGEKAKRIDLSVPFEFLDKDLDEIMPESATKNRVVDKLVKVHLKSGEFRIILFHVEIQGYFDEDFMNRMYQYYYRLRDRFKLPVSIFVIFTEKEAGNIPLLYEEKCWETELTFQFPTFHLDDYHPSEHEHLRNPFADALKIAWYGLKENKGIFKTDDGLLKLKEELFRSLLQKGYNKTYIRRFYAFIKHYVKFENEKYFDKFEYNINKLLKREKDMGLIELEQKYREEVAEERGEKRGEEKGAKKVQKQNTQNMLKANFEVESIMNLLTVNKSFVLGVQKEMEKDGLL